MARLAKQDWLIEGIKILSEFGQDKIKILYLCERLQVTRGSFYHHFESIDDYIKELMLYWEADQTEAFIASANEGTSAEERLEILNQKVIVANHKIEAAIRSWSFYNPTVKEILKKIDGKRLAYLEDILKSLTPNATMAKHMAMIDYSILVGMQQINPEIEESELRAMYETYKKIFEKDPV